MKKQSYNDSIMNKFEEACFNYYMDNIDPWYYEASFGKPFSLSIRQKIKIFCKNISLCLKRKFFKRYYVNLIFSKYAEKLESHDYSWLFNNLNNKNDRELLVKVVLYRVLGRRKVKLADIEEYNKKIEYAKSKINVDDWIQVSAHDTYRHYKVDARPFSDISVYTAPKGLVDAYIDQQYAYDDIRVESGDTVIDCGAYDLGNTLDFAALVGDTGRVFACEFIPENLLMCEKNLSLNTHLESRIVFIKHPVAESSGLELKFTNDSSCSRQVSDDTDGRTYKTICINDIVKQYSLSEVDFIKMDIEGSEMSALRGAQEIIKKCHPKLAISVYHKPEDLDEIPKFIRSLVPSYRFFLKHVGVYDSEIILFAKVYEN